MSAPETQFDPAAARFGPSRSQKRIEDESLPCKTKLLGVKGVGELGTIGATPATVHAVLDALADRGAQHIEMPMTPERVWRALGTRE